jgi:hypothetical protein
MLKASPNRMDTVRIKKLLASGINDLDIARELQIEPTGLKPWIKHFEKELEDEGRPRKVEGAVRRIPQPKGMAIKGDIPTT